jgi:PAS domain S-box-containing protein
LFEARGIELGARGIEADASLEAILDSVALPVWMVDHEGLVVFANPAALATLGFGELSELRGRHGHNTIHYVHPGKGTSLHAEIPLG